MRINAFSCNLKIYDSYVGQYRTSEILWNGMMYDNMIDLEEGFVLRHQKHYFQSPFSDSILNHVFQVLHCDYLNIKTLKLQNTEILP